MKRPLVAQSLGARVPTVPYQHYLGAFGPLLAAIVVTAATGGKAGVRDLVARFARWRVGWRWLALAVL